VISDGIVETGLGTLRDHAVMAFAGLT
jgi:hypothetical protein